MRKGNKIIIVLLLLAIMLSGIILIFYLWEPNPDNPKNLPPFIDVCDDKIGYANTTFRFNSTIYDPDGNISQVDVEWDFDGDGISDWNSSDYHFSWENHKQAICHRYFKYDKPGTYKLIVRAVDKMGGVSSDSCNVTVFADDFIFNFSIENTNFSIGEPINVTLSITNNGDSPVSIGDFEPRISVGFYITTPSGQSLAFIHWISTMAPEIIVAPHEIYNKTFDITDYWELTEIGNYNIKARYSNYFEYYWEGEFNSETLSFTIE